MNSGMNRTRGVRRLAAILAVVALVAVTAHQVEAQINMPDPSMIAGRALPAPELPDGTVSVRVVREAMGNNITGQKVSVTAGGTTKGGTTDEQGRAQMSGFPASSEGTATATVDGEALVSQPFQVPAKGGIRIILISGLKAVAERKAKEQAAEAAAPAVKGTVTIGGDSRIMLEFADDSLRVFYILYIVNTARAKVDVGGPLILDLPTEAQSAAVLEGSAPVATARGSRIIITGPFAPGVTPVQIAYGMPHSSSSLTIEQTFPAAMDPLLVLTQKVGGLKVASPQFTEHDEGTAQNGVAYLIGGGRGLPAGGTLTLNLTGLPVHSTTPRNVAIGLVIAILLAGAWFSFSGEAGGARTRLVERRDTLLGELVKIEEQRRAGKLAGGKYAARRQRLMADLERVYGELDGVPGGTGGGEAAA